MKWILLSILTILSYTLSAQNVEKTVQFSTKKHSFGKIKQNIPVVYNFAFTNKGNEKIIIEEATASCGCTIPEKPSQPILPGKTSFIKVQYNAAVLGSFNKQVYIKIFGYNDRITLTIDGEVIKGQ